VKQKNALTNPAPFVESPGETRGGDKAKGVGVKKRLLTLSIPAKDRATNTTRGAGENALWVSQKKKFKKEKFDWGLTGRKGGQGGLGDGRRRTVQKKAPRQKGEGRGSNKKEKLTTQGGGKVHGKGSSFPPSRGLEALGQKIRKAGAGN